MSIGSVPAAFRRRRVQLRGLFSAKGKGQSGLPSPFVRAAQVVGVAACVAWAGATPYLAFRLIDRLVGNRVSARVEVEGRKAYVLAADEGRWPSGPSCLRLLPQYRPL